MRCVERLVAEDAVDAEVLDGRKRLLLCKLVEHTRRHGRRVGAENILASLLHLPVVAVSDRAIAALFVDVLHALQIVRRNVECLCGIPDEERVVAITCRVLLRLEEGIEVPEGRFDEVVCRHFGEPHFEENLAEFLAHFHEWVKVTARRRNAERVEVVVLEFECLPLAACQHFCGEIGDGLFDLSCESRPLAHLKRLDDQCCGKLSLLEVLDVIFGELCIVLLLDVLEIHAHLVDNRIDLLCDPGLSLGIFLRLDPAVLHRLAESNVCVGYGLHQVRLQDAAGRDCCVHLGFVAAIVHNVETLFSKDEVLNFELLRGQ
eukprot:Opistho-2@95806